MHANRLALRHRQGITLLELIVALGVLIALAALLVPVALSGRSAAQAAKCVSNLRSIGVAVRTYINENNGFYPYNRVGNEAPNNLFLYQGLRAAGIDTYTGAGDTYESAGIWYCPSDKGRPEVHAAKSYGLTYYLGARRDDNPNEWQRRPMAAERSGGMIYMMDHDAGVSPKSTGGNLQARSWPFTNPTAPDKPPASGVQVEFRHKGGIANALFVDGHVEALRYHDIAGTNDKYLIPR